MKKVTLLIVFSVFIFLTSCEKEQNEPIISSQEFDLEPTRVVFEDWDEFGKISEELDSSNSEDFVMNWIFEQGHTSLYVQDFSDDESEFLENENLTIALLAIFNKDYEFQIGDEIISYNNGELFSQSILSDNSALKSPIGKIEASTVPIDIKTENLKSNTIEKVNIWSNGGTANLEDHIFTKTAYKDCYSSYTSGASSRVWKFRQLLKSVSVITNSYQNTTVYLECKLYINKSTGSSSFRYAESRRNYTYNFSGSITFPQFSVKHFSFNNVKRNCVGGSSTTSRFNRLFLQSEPIWLNATLSVSGSGTVTHELNGNSFSNRWVNSINW